MDERRVVWLGALSLLLASPCLGVAQNCKPNVSGKDRVTKAQSDVWAQDVSSTGFMSQVVLEKANVNLNVAIARIGDFTVVQLTLTKEEDQNKVARAVLESQYRAEAGNQIVLGFKEGGTPLTFVASRATSQTEVKGLLAPKLVTTVVLVAQIKDEELSALRDSIGARQFDVIRVGLSSQTIDKEMKGNGKKLSEKFACFFAFAAQKGFLRETQQTADNRQAASQAKLTAPVKYVRRGDNTDYMELAGDGTFSLVQAGKNYVGTYEVQGPTITLRMQNGPANKGRIEGNSITDPRGTVWEKQQTPATAVADQAKPASGQLTLDKIIQMVHENLPDDVIIAAIQRSQSKFDLTADDLIRLKKAGVSDSVIRVIVRP